MANNDKINFNNEHYVLMIHLRDQGTLKVSVR